ncbi:MAG: hypothetical protein LBJ63_00865 [Prevotellaceae bacterium]|nr:hypothetical protein [Prevotellaceae bacterium]
MKKIFLLLSVALLFATCKNDDDIVFPSQATITGADANECPATTVTLTAAAKDADSYQWKKDGTVINGETAATLIVTESGAYTAAGVNSAGTGTFSAVKNVTITACATAPEQATIAGDATNTCPEVTVVLTAAADGATSYEWKKDGTVINGETAATLTVTESGAYTAAGINSEGTGVVSAAKTVTITDCATAPEQATIAGDATNTCPEITVVLTATADGATSYEWKKDGTVINGQIAATLTVTESGAYTAAGINSVGTGAISEAKTVTITDCPPAQATIAGDATNTCPEVTVVLTAAADGATSYEWKKDGTVINGETDATLTVTESGVYTAAGVNAAGTGAVSAAKTVTITACTVPEQATITGDATNTCPEVTVVLTATATGATSYEWKKDGTVINGETDATFTVTAAGVYTAAGVNANGTGAYSAGKTVTITACPAPEQATISGDATNTCPAVSVTLTATATGATSYVWTKDGVLINGETAATLIVTAAGVYASAGVNANGTGAYSAGKTVTITACSSFIDDLVGSWNVEDFYIYNTSAYDNNHTITVEKINATTVKIHNFFEDSYDDAVTATVDNTARTITIAYQEIIPTWLTGYNTYLAAVRESIFCDNVNEGIGTLNVAGAGENLSITFPGTYNATIDGTPYPITHVWLGMQSSACAGNFGYDAGTVWTKQSASGTPPQAKKSSLPKLPKNFKRQLSNNNISVVK